MRSGSGEAAVPSLGALESGKSAEHSIGGGRRADGSSSGAPSSVSTHGGGAPMAHGVQSATRVQGSGTPVG